MPCPERCMPSDRSTQLLAWLQQWQAGQPAARDQLITHSMERCRLLARKMFRRQADLRTLEETDDVLQKAMMRLNVALATVRPDSVPAFFGLAARQIRWVLCDLADEHRSRREFQADASIDHADPRDGEPATLVEWTEFHQQVMKLPDEARDVFDLLYYQGLSQPEAAAVLGLSERTLRRRWQQARLQLGMVLGTIASSQA